MTPDWPTRMAVLGAGTMGSGFAEIFAGHGIAVALADADGERARAGRDGALERSRRFEGDGWVPEGTADRVERGIQAAESIEEALDGVDFVLEAVAEDPAVKREVFRRVEAEVGPDTLVATNTSAIPVTGQAESFTRPERFLGTHWFNPPQWVPCVEVIPSPATAPEAVERVSELLARVGKRPVTVGDTAGFVANRIQMAMFTEAARVVEEGVATPEAVDEVVRSSFGFRLPFFGPFLIADMAGLDVYRGAYAALEGGLGERFRAARAITDLVEQGRLGTKSGAGFLDHDPEEARALLQRRDAAYVALARLIEEMEAARAPEDLS